MSRPNAYVLTGVLLVFLAVFGGISVAQGGLYLDTHEGDTYHLLDVLFRMKQGLQPHTDFVTPLGLLSFLPIVLLMKSGLGVGMAILWAQLAVALMLLPAVTYAAASRLPLRTAYVFGLLCIGLVLALTYGGAGNGASISMHYNRWAWAASFVMLILAILPSSGRPHPILDGVLIGALAASLMLIKITFFVCLMPAVVLALLWRGERTALVSALVTGMAAVVAVAMVYGVSHWTGYLADLRNVTFSEVRPYVGVPFNEIVAGPPYIGGVVIAILSVFLLRRTGRERAGFILLLLIPAFLYITYQNFGNDPKWLLFLPVLLMAVAPARGEYEVAGVDAADASIWLSIAAVAVFLPSLVNLAFSPLNHAAIRSSQFVPMLPDRTDDRDIFIRKDRANTMTAQVYLDETSPVWAKYAGDAGRESPLEIGGISIGYCEFMAGARAFFVEIATDLQRADIPEGSQFFTTDILTVFWLFGPYQPLQNGAPWYYSGLSGLENADYVLVPKCSFVSRVHRIMIDDLNASEVDLELIRDNDLYALFRIRR